MENTIINNKQHIKEKFDFFLGKNIKLHFTKETKDFINGFIISRYDEEKGIYIVREDNPGRPNREIFVFISEIFDVEEYKEKVEPEDGR
jgi:hypothetical protein